MSHAKAVWSDKKVPVFVRLHHPKHERHTESVSFYRMGQRQGEAGSGVWRCPSVSQGVGLSYREGNIEATLIRHWGDPREDRHVS